MSSLIKDAKENIYAYEEKLVYDSKQGKEILKRVFIGRIDPKTRAIIPIEDEEILKNLPAVIEERTSKPEKLVIDTTKAGRLSFDPNKNEVFYHNQPVKIALEKKGSKKEINCLLSIQFDSIKSEENGIHLSISTNLTAFDRIVYDAVTTLYIEGGNKLITPQMIFHVMTGNYSKRLPPKYEKEINDSLLKMMYTSFSLNARQEGVIYPNLSDFVYRSYLLPGAMTTAKLNGTEVSCFRIFTTPPLYDYANRKNQIARIDLNLIGLPFQTDSEGIKRESSTSMTLKYYLLRRIVAIRNTSNIILYETVYEALGMKDAIKQEKIRIRKKIKEILDSWKNIPIGEIKILDFKEKKKKNLPCGIEINYEVIS